MAVETLLSHRGGVCRWQSQSQLGGVPAATTIASTVPTSAFSQVFQRSQPNIQAYRGLAQVVTTVSSSNPQVVGGYAPIVSINAGTVPTVRVRQRSLERPAERIVCQSGSLTLPVGACGRLAQSCGTLSTVTERQMSPEAFSDACNVASPAVGLSESLVKRMQSSPSLQQRSLAASPLSSSRRHLAGVPETSPVVRFRMAHSPVRSAALRQGSPVVAPVPSQGAPEPSPVVRFRSALSPRAATPSVMTTPALSAVGSLPLLSLNPSTPSLGNRSPRLSSALSSRCIRASAIGQVAPASIALHSARELPTKFACSSNGSRSSGNLRDQTYPTLLGVVCQSGGKDSIGMPRPASLTMDTSLKKLHGSVTDVHQLMASSSLTSSLLSESSRSLHGSTRSLQQGMVMTPRVPDRCLGDGDLKPPEGLGAFMQSMLNVSSEKLGGCPTTEAACFYSADATDSIDLAIAKQLLTLHREASLRLKIRRVRPGLYEIDGKQVSMRWGRAAKDGSGAPLLLAQEMPIEGRRVRFEEISLAAYIWQAVSGIAMIAPSTHDSSSAEPFVGLIPPEMRLTFEAESTGNLWDKNTDGGRYASMKKAVEQVKLREVAATALASNWPSGSPMKVPERGSSLGW